MKQQTPGVAPPNKISSHKTHELSGKNSHSTAFVIVLDNKKSIAVKKDWVQNPILDSVAKVFYSPNAEASSNFELPKLYYFNADAASCYTGYVLQKFGNLMNKPRDTPKFQIRNVNNF